MANKHQVLELLAEGLTPKEIAKKLKCSDGYVRATRQRSTPEVAQKNREWVRRYYHTVIKHGEAKMKARAARCKEWRKKNSHKGA